MARSTGTILVKFVKSGSEVKEFALEKGAQVSDLFDAADFEIGETTKVKVNSKSASESTTLKNGDIVTVAGKIEGGAN